MTYLAPLVHLPDGRILVRGLLKEIAPLPLDQRQFPERIIAAAIVDDHGVMFWMDPPNRHPHIIRAIHDTQGSADIMDPSGQGFRTSYNRFVDRQDALLIAIKAGQIQSGNHHRTDLFSEDLW